MPAPVTVEAAGPAGAVVTYTLPTATGSTGEPLPIVCVRASASTFPLGSSSVVCTAADAFGNQGAVVTYAASASDIVSGSVAVTCSKASGATFPIGTTVVNLHGDRRIGKRRD